MKEVCVITGGGSGMGLAAARNLPQDQAIVLSGRTLAKLEGAVASLQSEGYEAYAHTCDTSDRDSVRALASFAASLGRVKTVINAAGLSPSMAAPEQLIQVNALGTLYVNQEFAAVMGEGGDIVDVSSNSSYILPSILASKRLYALAEKDEGRFVRILVCLSNLLPKAYLRSGMAYGFFKELCCVVCAEMCVRVG